MMMFEYVVEDAFVVITFIACVYQSYTQGNHKILSTFGKLKHSPMC